MTDDVVHVNGLAKYSIPVLLAIFVALQGWNLWTSHSTALVVAEMRAEMRITADNREMLRDHESRIRMLESTR